MTAQDIFNDISNKLPIIRPSQVSLNTIHKFIAVSHNLKIKPVTYFIQVARNSNPAYTGLVIECLIIDETRLFDIVVGVDNVTINTIWLREIKKVEVLTSTIREVEKTDYFAQLNISYGSMAAFFYKTNIDRINEFFLISNLISNIK